MLFLEVEAAQHAAGGAALVVLHKFLVDARLGELILLIRLHEVAAVIAEHLRLNDDDTGDLGLRKRELTHNDFPLCFVLSFFVDLLYMEKPFCGFCA